jgi:hypothetical protein
MEIVKKNLISIICGVVALAAIVSAFYPLGGMWSTLQSDAQSRAGVFTEVKNLMNKDRTLPVVNASGGEAQKLQLNGQPLFPNPNVIEAAKTQLGIVKDNSDKFLQAAVQASERKPLVEGALPGNNPNPALETEFRNRYRAAMDSTAASLARSMPGQLLKAGCPPTADDVNRAATEVRKEVESAMLQKGPNGQELNRPAVDLEINARTHTLYDDLKQQSAERAMVYVNPDGTSFTFDPNFLPTATATMTGPSAIFWAQVNFWVQEEFCRAIANVNSTAVGPDGRSPAKNLLEAPVKHIMAVRVVPGFAGYSLTQQPQMVDPNNPPPPGVPFDRAAPLVSDPYLSLTGRKSGGIIDVVLYDVDLVVEADRVPWVLEHLGQGRYLSVAMVRSITPIDSLVQKAQGYLYGDKPCVKVSLQLEQVFMREWLLKYMPGGVKSLLQVADPAAPVPAG